MKIKNQALKITRYTAAAGAFILSGHGLNAAVNLGTITGDKILDNNDDLATIDINNDTVLDFIAVRESYTSSYSGYNYYFIADLLYGNATARIGLDNASYLVIRNYQNGESIGPLVRSFEAGAIDYLVTIPTRPLPGSYAGTNSFLANPDMGAIGVSLMDGGDIHYGYLKISVHQKHYRTILFDALYESDPNTPITVQLPAVPLMPLATGIGLGIIGLFGFLKTRNSAKKQSI